MSDEERLSKLEETLRKFNIVSVGSNSSQIVPRLDRPDKSNAQLSIGERIAALEKIHKEFRIVGAGNVRVEGSMAEGFCINSNCPGEEPIGFPNPVPPPTPPPEETGACCVEDVCSITTEAGCEGTYLGDGTDCDPSPCAPACVCAAHEPFYNADDDTYHSSYVINWYCGPAGVVSWGATVPSTSRFVSRTCQLLACCPGDCDPEDCDMSGQCEDQVGCDCFANSFFGGVICSLDTGCNFTGVGTPGCGRLDGNGCEAVPDWPVQIEHTLLGQVDEDYCP